MIYFDNAATTPVLPEVRAAMAECLDTYWGNPSSLHRMGFLAEKKLRSARESVARILRTKPETIAFTSGASESLNTVLRSAYARYGGVGSNVVISAVEHAAVYQTAEALSKQGWEVRLCPVDAWGRVDPQQMAEQVDEDTALVCLMQINNELGTIEPVEEVGREIRKKKPDVLYLVDGTQALGKMTVQPEQLGCDFYAASGHKIHAPKGVGLLWTRSSRHLCPLITGGPQEMGQRAGTENLPAIVAFAKALESMEEARGNSQFDPNILALWERAWERASQIPQVRFTSPKDGSPYILNFSFTGIRAEVVIHFMEGKEMYLSSGSACSKGKVSRILQAIQLPEAFLEGALRISFGRENKLEEVDPFFDELEQVVTQIRMITRN